MHLREVVRGGCLDSVLALLNEGVDVNIQDDDGDTALHIAAAEDRLDIVQALLNAGADVSIKNFKSATSLCMAAKNGNLEMASLLLDAEEDIEVSCEEGEWGPVHYAALRNHSDVVLLLLNRGYEADAQDTIGMTPLHIAAENNSLDVLKVLLNRVADINVKDEDGCTPLCLAALHGNFDVVDLLVENKADLDAVDQDGNTPIHLAIKADYAGLVEFLTQNGADFNVENSHHYTPLAYAAVLEREEIFFLLLANNADLGGKEGEIRGNQKYQRYLSIFEKVKLQPSMKDLLLVYNQGFEDCFDPIEPFAKYREGFLCSLSKVRELYRDADTNTNKAFSHIQHLVEDISSCIEYRQKLEFPHSKESPFSTYLNFLAKKNERRAKGLCNSALSSSYRCSPLGEASGSASQVDNQHPSFSHYQPYQGSAVSSSSYGRSYGEYRVPLLNSYNSQMNMESSEFVNQADNRPDSNFSLYQHHPAGAAASHSYGALQGSGSSQYDQNSNFYQHVSSDRGGMYGESAMALPRYSQIGTGASGSASQVDNQPGSRMSDVNTENFRVGRGSSVGWRPF